MKTTKQGVVPHFYYMDYMINRLFAGREDEVKEGGEVKAEEDGSNRVRAESIQTYHNGILEGSD